MIAPGVTTAAGRTVLTVRLAVMPEGLPVAVMVTGPAAGPKTRRAPFALTDTALGSLEVHVRLVSMFLVPPGMVRALRVSPLF